MHEGTTPFATHYAGIPQWQRQLALFEHLTKFNQTDTHEVTDYVAWHWRKNPTHLAHQFWNLNMDYDAKKRVAHLNGESTVD